MTPETQSRLESLVSKHCRIQDPYTLDEIIDRVEDAEYNAEMMLQHLLLWVSNNAVESPQLRDIIRRAEVRFFEDGTDGITASGMLGILREAKKQNQQ